MPSEPEAAQSERDSERFLHGDCHWLARAIHERTRWPLACLVRDFAPAIHAFALTPDGRAVDVTGATPVFDLVKRWAADGYSVVGWDRLLAASEARKRPGLPAGPIFGPSTHERAAVVAAQLVEALT